MSNQRGIATGWLYLIGLIVLIGTLTGLVIAWNSFTSGLIKQGHDAGVAETKAEYAKRDNEALRIANAEILRLTKFVRTKEQTATVRITAIATQLEKEQANGQAQRERDVVDVRAGIIRLRDPGADSPGPSACNQRAGTEATSSASIGDGRAQGQLSGKSAEFLLTLADDADAITRQLTAAQAVIVQDRVTCDGQ